MVCLTLPIAGWFSFFAFHNDPGLYARAVRVKQERLMGAGNSRIILAGGSNIAFSVDSARIEQTFHRPAINMGVSMFLGLRYMLAQIEPLLRSGDLVVIIPEDEQFYSDALEGTEELEAMLLVNPEQCRNLSWRQLIRFVKDLPGKIVVNAVLKLSVRIDQLLHGTRPSAEQLYSANGFERHGDFVAHLGRASVAGPDLLRGIPLKRSEFNPRAIAVLNRFARAAGERGARACFLWPVIADSAYRARAGELQWLQGELSARLAFPVCGKPEEAVLPVRYFFDSYYHANAEGRELRTRLLIEALGRCPVITGLTPPARVLLTAGLRSFTLSKID